MALRGYMLNAKYEGIMILPMVNITGKSGVLLGFSNRGLAFLKITIDGHTKTLSCVKYAPSTTISNPDRGISTNITLNLPFKDSVVVEGLFDNTVTSNHGILTWVVEE